jgi:hypothetical protein
MNTNRILKALVICACATAVVLPEARGGAQPMSGHELKGPQAEYPAPPSWRVAITEFMKDPAHVGDAAGEWFEIYNPMAWRLNIEGWTIGDDNGGQHTIANGGQGVFVRPGEYFVLGRSADLAANGSVTVDYVYTGFTMSNGSDQVVLRRRNGQTADRVAYDDGVLWPDQSGQSISLDPVFLDPATNDDAANWCHSVSAIGNGNPDTGTPGAANDTCP